MKELFKTKSIQDLFLQALKTIATSVNNALDSRFNSEEVMNNLVAEIKRNVTIDIITVDFAGRTSLVKMVPHSRSSGLDLRARVDYIFKFSGNSQLLEIQPSSRTFQYNILSNITSNTFTISYQTGYVNENLSDAVKQEVKSTMKPLIEELPNMISSINSEIEEFNSSIAQVIKTEALNKKTKIDLRNKQNNDLNDF